MKLEHRSSDKDIWNALMKFVCWIIFIGITLLELSAASKAAGVEAGAQTKGGLKVGSSIIHVTNLGDSGAGSLREAVVNSAARVVLFDVAGEIKLRSDLVVRTPELTIAGESAPTGGITLTGASMRIRTHDVVVRHIAVRPGLATESKSDNRDAISLDGPGKRSNGADRSQNILLENVSATWSVDEVLSLWHQTTGGITISDCIIGEGLANAGHSKGPHSMGLLVGTNIKGVMITGSLIVSNMFRNPVISQGASVYFANNYIYNPGHSAIHFYDRKSGLTTQVSIISNVVDAGPDTSKKIGPLSYKGGPPVDLMDVYISDNVSHVGANDIGLITRDDSGLRSSPVTPRNQFVPIKVSGVKSTVLEHAGMAPKRRHLVDSALIQRIHSGQERVISAPLDVDLEALTYSMNAIDSAKTQIKLKIDSDKELEQIVNVLCARHLEIGGRSCINYR